MITGQLACRGRRQQLERDRRRRPRHTPRH
jgi:hypothetical protein